MTINKDNALEIAQYAMKKALELGADHAAVQVESFHHLFTRYAKNHIIQNMEKNPVHLTLAVSKGKKECALSISGTDKDSINKLATRCINNSEIFLENNEHMPPVSIKEHRSVNAVDPELLTISSKEIASSINDVCSYTKKEGLESFGTHNVFNGIRCIVNSSGTSAVHEWTKTGFSVTAKTPDGLGSGRREEEVYFKKDIKHREMVEEAIETAKKSCNPKTLDPGDYTVILSPAAATAYLTFIIYAMDARMIEEGRSVFSNRENGNGSSILNERYFSSDLTVKSRVDDPLYPVAAFNPAPSFEGMSAQGSTARLFSHGLPTENRTYIKNGTVQDLFYSYYWASQKKKTPIGHPGLLEFTSDNGTYSVDELIASTKKGIYVSSLWYIRFVDMNNLLLTGLTRDGTFLIEDGKLSHPIKNFRFNESPYLSLQKISGIGKPELKRMWYQLILMPAMKIEDFTFSSISEAV